MTVVLEVTSDHAVPIEPLGGTATVLNASGGTLYYADNPQVSAASNQGSLTAGQSAAFTAPAWVVSAGLSTVTVTVQANSIGTLVISPSGDATGAIDRNAINAALANGLRVQGVSGGAYYIDQPVQPTSSSYLDMTGCTITNVTPTNTMVQNPAAVNFAATAADVTTTSGSAVITSPALIAGGAAQGNTVQVNGASYTGATLYGTIQSIAGNNITLSFQAKTTLANATAFLWTTRDHDITIVGGYWIEAWGTTPANAWHLRRIDRLTVRDVTFASTGTYSGANHLSFCSADITQFLFENIHFDTVNQVLSDGVHIQGPASNGSVINVTGTTHDDFIALSTVDGFNPSHFDTSGNLANITVDGVYPQSCLKAVHLYDGDASHLYTTTGLTIRNVMGSTTAEGVRIDGSGSTATGVSISEIAISCGSGFAMVELSQFSLIDATLENITWTSPLPATLGIVHIGQPGQMVYIRNLRMMSNPGGTNIACNVGNSTMYELMVQGVMQLNASPSNLIPLQFNAGTFQKVTLRNVNLRAGSPLVKFASATTVTNLHLEDILTAAVAAAVTIPAGNAAVTIRCTNVSFIGTNFITSQSPVTLKATNLDVNTTGAVVALTGAGATPVNMWMVNYNQAGAGADTSKDGVQVITLNKATYTTTTP